MSGVGVGERVWRGRADVTGSPRRREDVKKPTAVCRSVLGHVCGEPLAVDVDARQGIGAVGLWKALWRAFAPPPPCCEDVEEVAAVRVVVRVLRHVLREPLVVDVEAGQRICVQVVCGRQF